MRALRAAMRNPARVLTPLLALTAACSSRVPDGGPSEVLDTAAAAVREADIRASLSAGSVELEIPLINKSGGRLEGTLTARIVDLTKDPEALLGQASFAVAQTEPLSKHHLSVAGLPVIADRAAAGGLVISWSVALGGGELRGRTSLYGALGKLEVELRGATEIPSGGAVPFRVIARNPDDLSARPGARVVGVLSAEGQSPVTVLEGETDARGELVKMLSLPANFDGGQLRIEVVDGSASSWATTTLRALAPERLALSTDKTIYKPGQTVHLRLLGLSTQDKSPLAARPVLVEVLDGKGNKVIKRSLTTDSYGVAATALPTATEVNEGLWTFRAELAGAKVERKIPVARYNLPKLKVGVTVDRGFAIPGQPLRGAVDVRYMFGAKVVGATVALRAILGESTLATATAQTDAEGRATFDLAVPSGAGGSELEDGQLSVSVEAVVTDSAGQTESGAQRLPLAAGPLVLRVVPEADALLPGLENRALVLLRDPSGRPIAGQITATIDGARQTLSTAADGTAELRFTPAAAATAAILDVSATDGAARSVTRRLELAPRAGGSLVLRTDRALYAAGEKAQVEILASGDIRRVHLDVYRGGAGLVSTAVDLEPSGSGGRASLEIPITAAMRGILILDGLALRGAGEVVRASARALVDPEDRLNVALETAQTTYGPGEDATVRVRVKDGSGAPKVAVLGLSAVDEAVFALGGEPSDDLAGVFSLDPRSVPAGLTPSSLLGADERSLRWLFAAAPSAQPTGLEYNSVRQELPAVRRALEGRVRADLVAYLKRIAPQLVGEDLTAELASQDIVPGARRQRDPFGQYYAAAIGAQPDMLKLTSSGPDERLGSGDDVSVELWYGWVRYNGGAETVDADGQFRGGFDNAAAGGPVPAPAAEPTKSTGTTPSAGVKVRSDFRETVYVNPTVITDAQGLATVSFGLADSITTWRVTAHGSTKDGHLGSAQLGLRTFQSFFVDFDVPTTLTRGDQVVLPAVVYNYLTTPASVRVQLEAADWFELGSPAEQTVELGPSEVRAVHFTVKALKAGTQLLTLRGNAGEVSDALVREARVAPGGTKEEVSFSDKINGSRTHTISIPAGAIEGGTKVTLTLTPGFASEAVAGTESLLQEPHGCFEQTTSSAWPNTLVTKYLAATGQLTPELREKAFGLVSTGYQRLVTFESPSGGINWWGNGSTEPGNRILTSIMLWHLKDMEGIVETDPAFQARLLTWLLAQQAADGSFAAGDALHAGNEVLGTSVARTTAFISWALAHTGWADQAVTRASDYLRAHLPEEADLYANALAANALGFVDPSGAATGTLFARLDAQKLEADGRMRWPTSAPSWTGASGDVAAIETTGLVAYGLIKARAYPGNAAGAMRFIVSNKDAVGTWYNTQATMNALRALLAAAAPQGSEAEGTLTVTVNGVAQPPVSITRADGDLYRAIDLSGLVHPGDNAVQVTMAGQGELSYHLARRVHVPRAATPTNPELGLEVSYSSTEGVVGTPLTTRVSASYRGAGARDQVIVRVGLAPGFVPRSEGLEAIVRDGRAARYEVGQSDVTFYLMGLRSGQSRDLSFESIPSLAAEVEAPASVAYVYYEPAIRSEVAPIALRVR